ncbi:MAG: AcrR family transcriptional regulator [Verrucomicrobiales bacterium]|jgi:AcrR family transcriptional regulator
MGKANAKDRILETAGKLFGERGYSGVGINEIIQKSETAKATFYHHFPTKECLCETWLAGIHEQSQVRHQGILDSSEDPGKKLAEYFDGLQNYLESNAFRGCPYTNTATVATTCELKICQQVEQHKIFLRDFFRDLGRTFTASGSRAREVGDALFLLYSGASSEAQNLRACWPVEAAKRAAIEIYEKEKE